MPKTEVEEEKLDWFRSLQIEVRDERSGEYQCTCECGATLWYFCDCPNVRSWIDIHFEHRREKEIKFDSSTVDEDDPLYDFERHIKFTKEGFELFVAERKLKPLDLPELELKVLVCWGDAAGKTYLFYPNHRHETAEQRKELYATLCRVK